jgi:hypothetical protein
MVLGFCNQPCLTPPRESIMTTPSLHSASWTECTSAEYQTREDRLCTVSNAHALHQLPDPKHFLQEFGRIGVLHFTDVSPGAELQIRYRTSMAAFWWIGKLITAGGEQDVR